MRLINSFSFPASESGAVALGSRAEAYGRQEGEYASDYVRHEQRIGDTTKDCVSQEDKVLESSTGLGEFKIFMLLLQAVRTL
jgi:hypothetical protein